jgi:hypothetical protein
MLEAILEAIINANYFNSSKADKTHIKEPMIKGKNHRNVTIITMVKVYIEYLKSSLIR